jgi:biopolymer transport protein ExbD
MEKFNRRTVRRSIPSLTTAFLPNMIFILLFFFIVVTSMREVKLKAQFRVAHVTELENLPRKSLVTFIHVGPLPAGCSIKGGIDRRIQINDSYAQVSDIPNYIAKERSSLSKADQYNMVISLEIDKNTRMGVVSDIKQALRKAGVLNINYATVKDN